MSTPFKQLLLLIWKNWKLQIRHPIATVFEISIPIIFSVVLIFIRVNFEQKYIPHETIFPSFDFKNITWNENKNEVHFSPDNMVTRKIMAVVVKEYPFVKLKGFASEKEIVSSYLAPLPNINKVFVAVVFQNDISNTFFNSSKISYTIRPPDSTWYLDSQFPRNIIQLRMPDDIDGGFPGYRSHGFLAIQHAVTLGIIFVLAPDFDVKKFDLKMQRFPYPAYYEDDFIPVLRFYFPLALMLSFVYSFTNISQSLALEKELQLKEAMKIMGLNYWLSAFSWFLKHLAFLCISMALAIPFLTVATASQAVLTKSNKIVLYFILVIFSISIISMSFFLSTFFSKGSTAAAGCGVIYMTLLIPFFYIYQIYDELSFTVKILLCFSPVLAIALTGMLVAMMETTGEGLQWYSLNVIPTPQESLTISNILIMLIIDSVVFLILTWYIDAINPGEYGIPKVWYFPFTRNYWMLETTQRSKVPSAISEYIDHDSKYFEDEPNELGCGIRIIGLRKIYKHKSSLAVKDLYLNMYCGEITVLLGHNGAGKTTTISMIVGLLPASSGTVILNGLDIRKRLVDIRSSLGFCPQYDVLFPELTVQEHMFYYVHLKNYPLKLVNDEIERMINLVELNDKRYVASSKLSGGTKRKLSVAISLIGGSKIVIFDEPTSGMDVSARRTMWDIIKSEKKERTILLTTQFMDEADALGDRIAIMAEGILQCYGSPLFLKKLYGAGYYLIIEKAEGCCINEIFRIICEHVPGSEIIRNIGSELKFVLPTVENHKFGDLFLTLENMQKELKFHSFGVSIATMEEVFIEVTKQGIASKLLAQNRYEKTIEGKSPCRNSILAGSVFSRDEISADPISVPTEKKNMGIILFFQQFQALLWKRILFNLRKWPLSFTQLILSVVYLILSLAIAVSNRTSNEKYLSLSLGNFQKTTVPYAIYSKDSQVMEIANIYVQQFKKTHNTPKLISDKNITIPLLQESKKHIGNFNVHNIIGATFNALVKEGNFSVAVVALFNNQNFHSPALTLRYMDNMLLNFATKSQYELNICNYPFPKSAHQRGMDLIKSTEEVEGVRHSFLFSIAILLSGFCVFLIRENVIRSKHLQQTSGVKCITFWIANYLWDLLCYFASCLLMISVLHLHNIEPLLLKNQQIRLIILFIVFGVAILPTIYCFSYLFKDSALGYISIFIITVMGGVASLLIVTTLESGGTSKKLPKVMDWIFAIIFPVHCFGRSINNMYQNYQFSEICNVDSVLQLCKMNIFNPCCHDKCGENCYTWTEDYFSLYHPGIGRYLIILSVQALCFTFLLFELESNVIHAKKFNCFKRRRKISSMSGEVDDEEDVDDDVEKERQTIMTLSLDKLTPQNCLILKNVSKHYGGFVAVDNLSLTVRKGSCFGLLGLNGAGKTTLFKMITGEVAMTSGDIYIDGYSIRKDLRKIQQNIGYCPQFDALIGEFTGKETLTMFARIRGLPSKIISREISKMESLLEIDVNKLVKNYSGGNKRKLSVAVALMGNPPLVFLDEPTTGMDPVARENLWKVLVRVLKSGQSIILTSHSMNECEALCDSLVIMVNGKIRCLGSVQRLKTKFAQGFTLNIKVDRIVFEYRKLLYEFEDDARNSFEFEINKVKSYIETAFPNCILQSVHGEFLQYLITDVALNWSLIFHIMEEAKLQLNIYDYSVGQTTLEQVFLNFACKQKEVKKQR